MGGKAYGEYRNYQVECRDVLTVKYPEFIPLSNDGIDVQFRLADTCWTLDIALRGPRGSLLLAECRRTSGSVKQEDVAAFAYKVEMVRKTTNAQVAAVFFAMKDHQIGAVKVSQFNDINEQSWPDTPRLAHLSFLRQRRSRGRAA